MAGRVCIPIHNPDGKLVAYAGRWVGSDDWMRDGVMSGRNLVLEAAGIEPGYWDRVMLPLANAIRAERARARFEHRDPRPILPARTGDRDLWSGQR